MDNGLSNFCFAYIVMDDETFMYFKLSKYIKLKMYMYSQSR